LVVTTIWVAPTSAASGIELLPALKTTSSSIDAMAVGDLGAVTDVYEPHHDVVDAEIASNAAGQRTLGFIERSESVLDIKVAT
jgi:hypothetical protein